jgi:23S rRNA (uracil1939-C5)-methyltransferase
MPIRIESVAHGGDGIGRAAGKVVFVRGAVPGDLVEVEIVESRQRFDRAVVASVIEPSRHRVEPPCPVFGRCGGCAWQMASYPAQLEWKRDVVVSQLAHVGRLESEVGPALAVGDPYRYRNRVDLRTAGGRFALLEEASHTRVAIEDCLLVVEPLHRLLDRLEPGANRRVTLRAGVTTDEVVAIGSGPGYTATSAAVIHEIVGGVRFRISGKAFFQINTAGAEQLVQLVARALEQTDRTGTLVDGYAGGGLFAATVGAGFDTVVAIESDRTAVSDLGVNCGSARVVAAPVEEAFEQLPARVEAVVVDPPRQGLGRTVVEGIVARSPSVVVSVSCDPASAARDSRLLVDAGYSLDWVQPVDLFPQTPHIETVSRFSR